MTHRQEFIEELTARSESLQSDFTALALSFAQASDAKHQPVDRLAHLADRKRACDQLLEALQNERVSFRDAVRICYEKAVTAYQNGHQKLAEQWKEYATDYRLNYCDADTEA